jgi:metallo-beta-lactamase family protein
VYVVHGEPRSASALAARIREELHWHAVVPHYGERVRLDR